MLTDVLADKWQTPEISAWFRYHELAPVAVAVRHEADVDGLFVFKTAVYESNPLCLTVEKCLAMLGPEQCEAAIAIPALWLLLFEYTFDYEHYAALSHMITSEVSVPKGTVWQITETGFITCTTGAPVKETKTVKTKLTDDETLLVKVPFSAVAHKTLFSLLRRFAFLEVQ